LPTAARVRIGLSLDDGMDALAILTKRLWRRLIERSRWVTSNNPRCIDEVARVRRSSLHPVAVTECATGPYTTSGFL
jgi:hypothetical protein